MSLRGDSQRGLNVATTYVAPVSLWDGITAGFQRGWEVDRLGARSERYRQQMYDRHEAVRSRGVDAPVPVFMGAMDPMDRRVMAASPFRRNVALSSAEYENAIETARATQPERLAGVPTAREFNARLDADLRALAAGYDERIEASPSPLAARLLGGVAASAVDPVNLGIAVSTGGLGAGYGLLGRVGVQAGVGAASEGVLGLGVMAEAAAYGGPDVTGEDVALNMAAGALFGAGFELGGAGVSALLRRGRARALSERLDEVNALPDGQARAMAYEISDALDFDRLTADVDDPAIANVLATELQLAELATVYGAPARPVLPDPVMSLDQQLDDALINGPRPAPVLDDLFTAPSAATGVLELDAPLAGMAPEPVRNSSGVMIERLEAGGRPVSWGMFDPREIETDAKAMQFKDGGDASGVTDRLAGVRQWNPLRSGKVFVFERTNGARIIADGHQRLGLAKRLASEGADDIRLDGYLFREADGWTVNEMRTEAALKNIAEGSGTAIDAARVLRASGDDASLPRTGSLMRDAEGLRHLSDDAFGLVVNEVVSVRDAAIVGRVAAASPDRHAGMLAILKDGAYGRAEDVEIAARKLSQEQWVARNDGAQVEMFDLGEMVPALWHERNKAVGAATEALRGEGRAFNHLVNNASLYEQAGNALVSDVNAARAQATSGAAGVLARLAELPGPIREAVDQAARDIAAGVPPKQAVRPVVAATLEALEAQPVERLLLMAEAPSSSERAMVADMDSTRPVFGDDTQAPEPPESLRDDLTFDMFGDLAPDRALAARGDDDAASIAGCAARAASLSTRGS
jgi:hypothetical protein